VCKITLLPQNQRMKTDDVVTYFLRSD